MSKTERAKRASARSRAVAGGRTPQALPAEGGGTPPGGSTKQGRVDQRSTRPCLVYTAAMDDFTRALDEERLRSAAMLTVIRLLSSALFVVSDAVSAIVGLGTGRDLLPLHGAWLAASFGLWWLARRNQLVLRVSWVALVAFDLPVCVLGILLLRQYL